MSEIAERFERIVSQHPELVAVKSGDRELTYRQLNTLANRLARAISVRCPNHSGTVALFLEHGLALSLGTLACLKANRVFVPLDHNNPFERQCRIIDDAESQLVVVDETCSSPHPSGVQVVSIDEMLSEAPSADARNNPRDDDLAFILYTSGSTGIPKGVMYQNRAVVARVAENNRFGVGSGDRLTALGSGGMNLFRALLTGATLVSLNLRTVEVDRLAHWLREERITIYHSVPTVFRRFVATLSGKEDLPQLRVVNLTGETLLSQDVEAFRKHFPDSCVLVNGLGATEVGTFREFRIDSKTVVAEGVVPVGNAVEGTEVLLLDGNGNEVEPGQVGEIAVRGEHISPGYWKRPDLTRACFLPAEDAGERRMYRTGDLGQFLPDGSLLHLGRADFQVKIRGNRVEVGEVESALLNHLGIKEAAVVGQRYDDGTTRLVGYVVAREADLPRVDELLSFLRQRLPEYMVPSTIVCLHQLPVTPNGKLDRKALPFQAHTISTTAVPREAPRNETEKRLAEIWSEILQIQHITIHDDFFALGGDSLSATRFLARVLMTFQTELPLSTVFRMPTIAQLAEFMGTTKKP
jgi:amino acid adenylation domain-containing protein